MNLLNSWRFGKSSCVTECSSSVSSFSAGIMEPWVSGGFLEPPFLALIEAKSSFLSDLPLPAICSPTKFFDLPSFLLCPARKFTKLSLNMKIIWDYILTGFSFEMSRQYFYFRPTPRNVQNKIFSSDTWGYAQIQNLWRWFGSISPNSDNSFQDSAYSALICK